MKTGVRESAIPEGRRFEASMFPTLIQQRAIRNHTGR